MPWVKESPTRFYKPEKEIGNREFYAFEILKATIQSGRVDSGNHEYAVTNAIKLAERFISEFEGK